MWLQLALDTTITWLLYSLAASGFHLASTCCRHFAFAAGMAFITAPLLLWSTLGWSGMSLSAAIALGSCICLGAGYCRLAAVLRVKGCRGTQLLIISLALLAASENLAIMLTGAASVSLWDKPSAVVLSTDRLVITRQLLTVLVSCAAGVLCLWLVWSRSLLGIALRALFESRWNLALRGYNVRLLETIGTAFGFGILGVAGILWASLLRVRPVMGFDIAVLGVAAVLAAPLIKPGFPGVVWSCMGIVVIRLALSLYFDGDWNLTAILLFLILIAAFTAPRAVLRQISAAQ